MCFVNVAGAGRAGGDDMPEGNGCVPADFCCDGGDFCTGEDRAAVQLAAETVKSKRGGTNPVVLKCLSRVRGLVSTEGCRDDVIPSGGGGPCLSGLVGPHAEVAALVHSS